MIFCCVMRPRRLRPSLAPAKGGAREKHVKHLSREKKKSRYIAQEGGRGGGDEDPGMAVAFLISRKSIGDFCREAGIRFGTMQ